MRKPKNTKTGKSTPKGDRRKDTARPLKVLIADEDQPLVDRLKTALEERDYRVLAAIDGTQALDHARKETPDYLVLDLLTPTVDGGHLYQHLKKDPRFRSLPLIVLAGTSPESADWLKDVKAEAYIAKRGVDAILEDLFSILQTFEEGATPPTWAQETGGLEMLEPRLVVTELLAHTPHLNALLHNLEEAVLLLDPSHRIVYVNPAGVGLLKRHERDLVGAPLSTIFHAEPDESFLEVLSSLATREGLATERLTYAHGEHSFHITITNLLGKEGNAGQLLLIRDVSGSLRRLQELAALNELSSLLTSTLDLKELLQLIMDRTEEFLGVEASSLLLKDDETDELVVQIALGEYGQSVVGRRLKVGQGIAGWAFEHGAPLLVPDVRKDRRFYQGVDYNTGFTTKSVICVPLKTREKVIGVMQVLNRPSDPPFTQDDMNLLSAIATHAATAIERARLFQETETRADKLGALNELSALFTSTLDLNELLQLIMQRIQNLLGVEASSLLLKDDEKDELVIRIGVGEYGAEVVGRRLKVGQGIAGWVFEQGAPLMIPDVSKDARFYQGVDSDTGFTTKSVLCVPLTTRDKVIGVIQLLNGPSDRPFTEDDVNLLSALAAHAATAIDQARLFQETETRADKLVALNELSSLITSTLDLNDLLQLIMQRIHNFLGVEASSLLLKDDEKDELVFRVGVSEYGAEVVGRRLKVGQGIAGWVFEHGAPLMVPDVRKDRRFYQGVDYNTGFTTKSVICVPLKTREKVIGVMQVLNRPSDPPFTQDDMNLLSAIATHAATAIERARLFQETETRADKLGALNELSALFTSTLDLNELLQLIMQRIQNLLGVEASSLLLKDDEKDELVIRIGVGEYGAEVVGRRLKVGQGIAGWVFEQGAPLMIPDVSKDARFYQGVDSDTGFTTKSVLCVPLTTRDKVIGVIQLLNGPSDRPFTEDDVNLLSALAAHAATAIDQARLFQETETRADKLVALNELSSLITSTLDLNDLLQLIMQRIHNFLGVEASSLLLKDDEKDELVFRVGVSEYGAEVVGRRLKVGQGIAGWVFEHGAPLMVPDVWKDRRFYQGVDYDTGFKTRSVLCVPLSTRDKVIGVIQALNSPSERPFTEDDVNLLSALAAHAGTAIENARLFEETQTRAEKVGALAEVSQAVSSSLDLENVFELVIRATSELLDAPVASLWTLEGDELVLREGRGIYSEVWDRHLHMVEQLAAWIVQQREPVVVREFAEDPRIKEKEGARPSGLHACAGFPLRVGKRCLGVLMLFRTSPEPFKQEDVEFLSVFANQAAVAIDHARLYQELQSHSANLQQVVRNRKAEIERKSLDLDRANQAKSEFLITMSHELKTSLGVVVAFAQLLEQQPPGFMNEKQAKYVTNIHGGARHVLALINNIVDLSAVDAGKLELHPEVVKVPEMLLSILAELRPQADAKRIQFSVDVKKCPPKLMADRHRLRQIIYILLSNAVHYTPEEGRISVEAETQGDVAEFSVSDTGIGIKAEDLQRVFDRFAHLEAVKSTERRGTRLGLALAKHLVELHGGAIRAESGGPGQGATFTISLPLRSTKASQD